MILFTAGPDVSSSAYKRALFDENLRSLSGIEINCIQKRFTIVIDGEASMARLANSSFSSRASARDEKWMRYYDQVLQNCIKSAFSLCADDSSLQKTEFDFTSIKLTVEYS